MYLENLLKAIDEDANVKVYIEEDAQSPKREFERCLGNHYVQNWERGLIGMRKAFQVTKAELEYVSEGVPTWKVTVRCAIENWVYRLDRMANMAASVVMYQ